MIAKHISLNFKTFLSSVYLISFQKSMLLNPIKFIKAGDLNGRRDSFGIYISCITGGIAYGEKKETKINGKEYTESES